MKLNQGVKLRIKKAQLKVGKKKIKKPSKSTTGSSLRTVALATRFASFRSYRLEKIIKNNVSKEKPSSKNKLAKLDAPPSLKELQLTDVARTDNLVPPRQVRKRRPIVAFT
jgi:hypothetical protein